MKVVIVAKTRMRGGACVGAISFDGQSVRLIAPDMDHNAHFNLDYQVGETWEIEGNPPESVKPPHVENVVVLHRRRLQSVSLERVQAFIEKVMPPVNGGPELLYDGLAQVGPGGSMYIAESTGCPARSTLFWRPDRDLVRDEDGKRIRYRYPAVDGGRTLAFVGFQEPVDVIPAGSLVRVSLAHWWRPEDKEDVELRCYVQLSGWFEDGAGPLVHGNASQTKANTFGCPTPVVPTSEPAALLTAARGLLKVVFGYEDFLPLQADIIANVLARRDSLAIMSTGGGKSMCYQLPALLFDGITVVVSPLISLMQDQVDALHQLGIPAAFLNCTVDYRTYVNTMTAVRHGAIKLVYMAPETLLRPETLVMLDHARVSCITIDEAHCISSWGHDFRPEYRQLLPVRQRYPDAVCLALTATATQRVQEDITEILGFGDSNRFIASFNRPNLFLEVRPRIPGLSQILTFLDRRKGQSGIIYCHTRHDVETLAEQLTRAGWPALPYHAGMDDVTRGEHQRRFSRDETPIIVATIAFGMGINKSNVRFIVHAALPKNLENYYQEIGRAGRDGLRADCLLLWGMSDVIAIRHFIDEGPDSERPGKESRLQAMLRYAQTTGCRRSPLLTYFSEPWPETNCTMCDNCLAIARNGDIERVDVTETARLFVECVQQTGESFGPKHITDVLRGSHNKDVLRWNHDRVPTYDRGGKLSAQQWWDLAQQLITLAILKQDDRHGGLSLGSEAKKVMAGERILIPAAAAQAYFPGEESSSNERPLFEELRKMRTALAQVANVPPYVIFSDRTLQEMVARLPHSPESLLAVPGVSERKLMQYGQQFLDVIRSYCAQHGLHEQPVSAEKNGKPKPAAGARRTQIAASFTTGMSVAELQRLYGVKEQTVIQHLYEFARAGGAIDGARLPESSRLNEDERARVLALFDEHGVIFLRPIFDATGGAFTYDDLRLLRLYYMTTNRGHETPCGSAPAATIVVQSKRGPGL